MRYVRNGEVVERFVGFEDVGSRRTSEDLFKLLTEKFFKFDLENKLIAQSYDGSAVMAGHLNDLQVKIKSVAPQALFTHCYSHSLNLVLSAACSSIAQIIFSKSAERTNVLNTICGNRLPTYWNFTTHVVSTVYAHKIQLIEILEYIICRPGFDKISITGAVGLKKHLEDSNFLFFLEVFHLIFQQTDVIFSSRRIEIADSFSRDHIQALLSKLKDFRNDQYFENISFDQSEFTRRKMSDIADPKTSFKQAFYEIMDAVTSQIEIRFADTDKLIFF
ncbi:hypothetical protein NQ317_013974 [Molorchus minor]|uniref:DUF4371 domain-containing protein n=1 Tax=Molorchus minor TaxID=1323400 RepID=A0ABQ9IW58_9CUCU|nr:hypothetical protein NQ317_013974 [Molorchus minor]